MNKFKLINNLNTLPGGMSIRFSLKTPFKTNNVFGINIRLYSTDKIMLGK